MDYWGIKSYFCSTLRPTLRVMQILSLSLSLFKTAFRFFFFFCLSQIERRKIKEKQPTKRTKLPFLVTNVPKRDVLGAPRASSFLIAGCHYLVAPAWPTVAFRCPHLSHLWVCRPGQSLPALPPPPRWPWGRCSAGPDADWTPEGLQSVPGRRGGSPGETGRDGGGPCLARG